MGYLYLIELEQGSGRANRKCCARTGRVDVQQEHITFRTWRKLKNKNVLMTFTRNITCFGTYWPSSGFL